MQKAIRVIVSGRVQGVGYRMFAVEHALQLDLTGWVRNLYDGTVEALAEGNEKDLISYLAELETGPGGSRVMNCKVEWLPYSGNHSTFQVRSTWISD